MAATEDDISAAAEPGCRGIQTSPLPSAPRLCKPARGAHTSVGHKPSSHKELAKAIRKQLVKAPDLLPI